MLRVFQNDLADPDRFVVTLELVPGRELVINFLKFLLDKPIRFCKTNNKQLSCI